MSTTATTTDWQAFSRTGIKRMLEGYTLRVSMQHTGNTRTVRWSVSKGETAIQYGEALTVSVARAEATHVVRDLMPTSIAANREDSHEGVLASAQRPALRIAIACPSCGSASTWDGGRKGPRTHYRCVRPECGTTWPREDA